MAVTLQVRDVRAEIYKSAGGLNGAGPGPASTALLGRIFHETFADLVGSDGPKSFFAAIAQAEESLDDWRMAAVNHAYERLIGGKLYEHQAELRFVPDQVLTFWDAVQEMCGWLSELYWQAKEKQLDLQNLSITAEEPLRWEVWEEGWTDRVVLTGVADAVWRLRENQTWCVIELKTGRTAPEADLAQACLYHQMLSQSGLQPAGALALISFGPQKTERVFDSAKLAEAQQKLRRLIGKMAGVLPDPTPVAPPRPVATDPYRELGRSLERAYAEYGAEIKVGRPIASPTFLRFPIELGRRVLVKSLRQRDEEVQIKLCLDAPPRISNEDGRLSIDLQRPDRELVFFSEVKSQLPKIDSLIGNAKVPVGVDLHARLQLADFSKPENTHMLVAGTTGSGKSEWLRTAVAGLLLTNTTQTLRFAFADPKRAAFQHLRNSPYLFAPIAYEESEVLGLLECLVEEMESRYEAMGDAGADTIKDLVLRDGRPVARIFFVCDEYGYLMTSDLKTRRHLETLVKKLGNKARAAGIHLILATQQPSRQVITGPIQTNINARVGLRLPSAIESQMLLSESGAESLLGKGDLLYKCIGDPIRLQSPYLPPEELQEIFGGR